MEELLKQKLQSNTTKKSQTKTSIEEKKNRDWPEKCHHGDDKKKLEKKQQKTNNNRKKDKQEVNHHHLQKTKQN